MGCEHSTGPKVAIHKLKPADLKNLKRCRCIAPCGHRCGGVQGEAPKGQKECGPECFGCTDAKCGDVGDCPVCLEPIADLPSVRLQCKHSIHYACICEMLFQVDWMGKEVRPAEIHCPAGCGRDISHPLLDASTKRLGQVTQQALAAAHQQGRIDKVAQADVARKYVCFQCFDCSAAFVGGLHECMPADEENRPEPSTVVCDRCRSDRQKRSGVCHHSQNHRVAKCDWCCAVATYSCGGGESFWCEEHHQHPYNGWKVAPCDPAKCPFGGEHPTGKRDGVDKETQAWLQPCEKCRRKASWDPQQLRRVTPPPSPPPSQPLQISHHGKQAAHTNLYNKTNSKAPGGVVRIGPRNHGLEFPQAEPVSMPNFRPRGPTPAEIAGVKEPLPRGHRRNHGGGGAVYVHAKALPPV